MLSRSLALLACLTLPHVGNAADNAALIKFGAQIQVTCDNPKPLNTRWAQPENLLRETKPGGPIINDLATAKVTLRFPLPVRVQQVGIAMMGHKDGWPRASWIEVRVNDQVIQVLETNVEATGLQLFPIPVTTTDHLVLVVTEVQPAGAKVAYGGFSQIVAMVEDDLTKDFAAPCRAAERTPMIMAAANLDGRPDIKVLGEPRVTIDYPRTIWDAQDIAEIKQQIATIPEAKDAYERCIAFCEQLCAKPVQVPEQPDDGVDQAVVQGHTRAVDAIANLGIGYALSGDERFAKEAARLLLRYADLYEGWPVHGSPHFRHDKSKWSWQRLGDAIWLIQAAWGFDLIHASPSLSDEDRAKITDHFVMPCVRQILSSPGIITAPTNWSAICCAAVMIGARVSGDEKTYRMAIDGLPSRGGKKAPPEDGSSGNNGGVYFFIDKGLDDDGLWAEGAMGYQFMAMRGMVVMAEILWRDGVDVWSYRNGRLKLLFDSPIWYHYPGGRTSPAIHDSGSTSLFGRDSHLYQYAARRYGDATYNAILSRVAPSFASIYNLFLPAIDYAPVAATGLPEVPSILFPGVGFATARMGEGDDTRYLLMDYGPNRSHGHPDKLSHCFFALGQELFADGGSAWYSTDIYRDYYNHTLAHNTILANGQRQIPTGGRLESFVQAGELAVIRATCDSAIPATGLDRTLVLFGNRLYDLYQAKSTVEFTLDLPYHSHGTIAVEGDVATKLQPWEHEDRTKEGYTYFSDPQAATWDGDWSCTWTVPRGIMRMHMLGEPGSELVFATTPKGGSDLGTVLVRRKTADTAFASVCDIIPTGSEPSLRSIRQLRAPDAAGLAAALMDGGSEVVLVNQGTEVIELEGWKTDAGVAALRRRGDRLEAFVLSGGTVLSGSGVDIAMSERGLISAYVADDTLIRVTNHGAMDLTVTWGGLTATHVAHVAADGTWSDRQAVTEGRFLVPAHGAVDLSHGGDVTVAQIERERRLAKQQAAWDAEQLRLAEQAAEAKLRLEAAAREPVPTGTVVLIEAEAFTDQGGGTVSIPEHKAAAHGKSISLWNDRGHWLDYALTVEHTGWYQIGLKYCLEGDGATRSLRLNGEPIHPSLNTMTLTGTGGWSNGADQWSLIPICLPESDTPMLVRLEQGEHVIRLENAGGGGVNLDYIVLVPATASLTRKLVEQP